MKHEDNSTAGKLLRAFMRFRRVGWHERTIAGNKPSEMKVLFVIKRAAGAGSNGGEPDSRGLMVSEISRLMRVTKPTVTQMLKELEAKQLIERATDPTDRRIVRIRLTAIGEQVLKKAKSDIFASLEGLIEYLGEEQSDQLADLLSKSAEYYANRGVDEERC